MPEFSKSSADKLATCDQRLQDVCNEAIKETDFTVVYGHRTREDQNLAYQTGKSRLNWPDSKHNSTPSMAVDLAPYPIDWNDLGRFHKLSEVIKRIAAEKNIPIEWGGDWKTFKDYPHFQLTV